MRRRLIVNADDLGRTPGVNAGVAAAHQRGIVTSATLMVNYPAAAEVPRLAAESPRLGIGLHVQLTGGRPLLPRERIPGLVDADGRLPPRPEALANADAGEIAAEARAQLTRFRALLGRDPTHFDSHHHAHRMPVVFAALMALALESSHPLRLAEPAQHEPLRAAGIATSDCFAEGFFDEGATLEGLLGILEGLPSGTTELMCHPAIVDDELRSTSGYALPRARELQILTSEAARRAVEDAHIQLVHFGDL